jgi:hypothetical protein
MLLTSDFLPVPSRWPSQKGSQRQMKLVRVLFLAGSAKGHRVGQQREENGLKQENDKDRSS